MKQHNASLRGWIKIHRKLLLAISIPAILLAGGIMASVLGWSGYRSGYLGQKNDLHESVDEALNLPMKSSAEKSKKLDVLNSVASNLHAYSCSSVDPIRWEAQIVSTYKSWLDECDSIDLKMESLAGALDDFIGYMKNDQEFSLILKPLLDQSKDVTESDFSSRYETWQKAAQQVGNTKEVGSFTSVKKAINDTVNGVTGAWKSIIDASSAKDENAYEAAHESLLRAYSNLDAIKNESDKQSSRAIKKVEDLYSSAF